MNKGGARLTEDEIQKAKYSLEKSIDDAAKLSKSDRVIEFLTDNPSQSPEIAEMLGVTNQHALNILASIKRQGKIRNYKKPGDGRFTWELNV
jgi:DNA-binding MarR family transcriptional regulator